MAAFLQCEQCDKRAVIETGFLRLPEGWVELRERKADRTVEHQFCGLGCSSDWARAFDVARRESKEATDAERGRADYARLHLAPGEGERR